MDEQEQSPLEEPLEESTPPQVPIQPIKIAGFWRRGSAAIIDAILLGLPVIIAGFLFRDFAFTIGPWGRLIGYGILFAYWTFFNSKHGHGQTIGKKVMKIVVVDRYGEYLPVYKSALRALTTCLIGLLNGWPVPIMQYPVVGAIASTIIFGGIAANVYGLIFNRRSRQGIHDLIVQSFVVHAPPPEESTVPEPRRIHAIISYGLVGVAAIIVIALFIFPPSTAAFIRLEPGEMDHIHDIQTTLMDSGQYFTVGVTRSNQTLIGKNQVQKDLNIQVWVKMACNKNSDYCRELPTQIARTAFELYPDFENLTGMRIAVMNAFDLGLATGNLTDRVSWTIDDWKKALEK